MDTAQSGILWDVGLAFLNLAFWKWGVRVGMLWAPFVVLSVFALGVAVTMWTSRTVWQATPISAIQLPWRILTVAEIAIGLGLAGAVSAAGTRLRQLVGMIAAAVVALPLILWFQAPAKRTDYPWALDIQLAPTEWLAKGHGLDFLEMHLTGPPADLRDTVNVVATPASDATLAVEQDTLRRIAFSADCPTGCQVTFHRSFWKFWEMTDADGEKVPIVMTRDFPLITADLPSGQGRYQLALARPRSEIVGGVISALALLALLGAMVCSALLARRRRGPKRSS